jgi:hypothetical protein
LDLGWGVAENTGEGLNRTEMKWRLVWDSEKACEVKSQDRTRKFFDGLVSVDEADSMSG